MNHLKQNSATIRFFVVGIAFILFTAKTIYCFGQENFHFYQFQIDDGLAHKNIYELYQDRENYIWIGARTTLQRYDGNRFISYNHIIGDTSSIAFGHIRAIFEDSQNRLWVGTDGDGLSVFIDGQLKNFHQGPLPHHPPHIKIERIIELPDSTICMASWGGGIITYKNGEFGQLLHDENNANTISSNMVVDILYDEATERLWVATWGGGLCYIHNGNVIKIPQTESGYNHAIARKLIKTPDGAIWIGTWGKGLYRFKDETFTNYSTKNNALENDNILTLSYDKNELWIGTWGGGLTLLKNGKFKTFREDQEGKNAISSDFIESSLVDNQGNIWIGTYGGGITKLEKSQFKMVDRITDGKKTNYSNYITSIIETKTGVKWASGVPGVFIETPDGFSKASKSLPNMCDLTMITAMMEDQEGNIWLGGSTDMGLYRYKNNQLEDLSVWEEIDFHDYFIHDIMQSSDGSIWISADVNAGLIRIKDNQLIRYWHDPKDPNSLSSNNIYKTAEAADGSIWVCTSREGISVFKDGKFKRYKSDDLNPNSLSNNYCYSMLKTKDGTLWIGTELGLNKYNPETDNFTIYLEEDGLLNNSVVSLLEDDEQNIWLGSAKGVTRFDPAEMRFINYDKKSGIKGQPFHRNAIMQSQKSKNIYISGLNGLTLFHPDSIRQSTKLPTIQLTNVLIDNQSIYFDQKHLKILRDNLSLPHSNVSIAFEYSDMSFGTHEEFLFSYRIKELDPDWHNAGQNLTAIYSNIPAGDYVFEVRSSFDGKNWCTPTQFHFYIEPNWWETSWFKMIIGIIMVGLIPLFIVIRFQYVERQKAKLRMLINIKTEAIRKQKQQLQEKSEELHDSNIRLERALTRLKTIQDQRTAFQENEREAISREVHDSISSLLFGIRMMVNQGKSNDQTINVPAAVDGLIGEVIKNSQIILNNLSTNFSKHNTFYDSLNDLVVRSQKICNAQILLEWNGPHQIDNLGIGANLFRIIQESLANALRHSNATHISICVINQENIMIMISDDGMGFDAVSQELWSQGLITMHKRAEEIGASLDIFSVEDKGTVITIEMKKLIT